MHTFDSISVIYRASLVKHFTYLGLTVNGINLLIFTISMLPFPLGLTAKLSTPTASNRFIRSGKCLALIHPLHEVCKIKSNILGNIKFVFQPLQWACLAN